MALLVLVLVRAVMSVRSELSIILDCQTTWPIPAMSERNIIQGVRPAWLVMDILLGRKRRKSRHDTGLLP